MRSESLEQTSCLEKTESLEDKILSKMNNALADKRFWFRHAEDTKRIHLMCEDMIIMFWTCLSGMLFTRDRCESTIFEDIRTHQKLQLHHAGFQAFCEAGLMSLEGCSSLEEVLLRLEILFPDV